MTSQKDFIHKETEEEDAKKETRSFLFESCRETEDTLADHTANFQSSIIHAATGYTTHKLQIGCFPSQCKRMHELAAKERSH